MNTNQNSLFEEYKGILETEDINSYSKKKGNKIFSYNPFALQDAIGERNIKKIWIEYIKLRLASIEPEILIYNILSKIRTMVAVKKGANRNNLDINEYSYNRSKKDAENWKRENLENLYSKLVEIYHRSRISGEELGAAIEKTLLSI